MAINFSSDVFNIGFLIFIIVFTILLLSICACGLTICYYRAKNGVSKHEGSELSEKNRDSFQNHLNCPKSPIMT